MLMFCRAIASTISESDNSFSWIILGSTSTHISGSRQPSLFTNPTPWTSSTRSLILSADFLIWSSDTLPLTVMWITSSLLVMTSISGFSAAFGRFFALSTFLDMSLITRSLFFSSGSRVNPITEMPSAEVDVYSSIPSIPLISSSIGLVICFSISAAEALR